MGRSYLIECPKCGYKASVSGGEDSGLSFMVQTTACRDCRRLFDSVVRLRVADSGLRNYLDFQLSRWRRPEFEKPPAFEEVLNLLPPLGIKRFKWVVCESVARFRWRIAFTLGTIPANALVAARSWKRTRCHFVTGIEGPRGYAGIRFTGEKPSSSAACQWTWALLKSSIQMMFAL